MTVDHLPGQGQADAEAPAFAVRAADEPGEDPARVTRVEASAVVAYGELQQPRRTAPGSRQRHPDVAARAGMAERVVEECGDHAAERGRGAVHAVVAGLVHCYLDGHAEVLGAGLVGGDRL